MTDHALTQPVQPVPHVKLAAGVVLSQTWGLYKRLFLRSVLMAAVVFATLDLVQALVSAGRYTVFLGLFSVLLTVFGIALLQGGLVEIVRGLHVDGDDNVSTLEVFQRASGRVWKLVRVSLWYALGVSLGLLLFIVPGIILALRWSVAVPVAMLEDGSPRDGLRRSRAMVVGNMSCIFMVLIACAFVQLLVSIPFSIAATGAGAFGQWAAATVAAALTTPYAAHALTVIYYSLLEPERPVVLAPGHRWESVWQAQDENDPPPPPSSGSNLKSLEEEQMRKFEEREKQWGG